VRAKKPTINGNNIWYEWIDGEVDGEVVLCGASERERYDVERELLHQNFRFQGRNVVRTTTTNTKLYLCARLKYMRVID